MSICVDDLSNEVTEARLNSLLAEYGSLKRIHLSAERQTGRVRGMAVAFKSKHTCPCCSSSLLRHISSGRIHWRCSHCSQEMPVIKVI